MKKILITGSNGLLGQKLVYALASRNDFEVIATSVGENRLLKKDGYTYHPLDITDKTEVEMVMKKFLPDVVINTAAMTNVDACETKREECWNLNVNAVKHIADSMETFIPGGHMIHLSTDFIFDGEKGYEYEEEDKPNPLSYYALSKWESEKVLHASKIKSSIARTIIVYGIVDNMSRSNIVLWAKDSLSKGLKINVVEDQFRSPTLAEDLADGCIRIAEKGAVGTYHLSGPETLSILELVWAVADFWKLDKTLVTPVKSVDLKQPAKRPPYTGFIIDKARTQLGYDPKPLIEGLKILDQQLKSRS